MPNSKKFPSELRLDPVSKDWVLIATGRARRPETFRREPRDEERKQWEEAQNACPFDNVDKQECPTYAMFDGKEVELPASSAGKPEGKMCIPEQWTTISLPNKYPAFAPQKSFETRVIGPYQAADGVGFHEVIVTKDHAKDIPEFSIAEIKEMVDLYHARYTALKTEEFVNYISVFKNKGPRAGATIAHPHSQLIATPIADLDIVGSLQGSAKYFEEKKKCIHCEMLEWDKKDKQRIVYENRQFLVVCPFASRVAFEVRIYPKEHSAYFENTIASERGELADALLVTMKKLYKGLKDPDYNYFLHTAPADEGNYDHYHWHWEILPKTSTWAGFELGAGIEISTIEPEKAAAFLRKS
jgi:UDPglucose--hexose-1-phosphate uridylyltransferase